MALRDMWNSTLVYFGVREEEWEDEYYDDGTAANQDLERSYSERPNVRRLSPRRRAGAEFDEIFSDEPPVSARRSRPGPTAPGRRRRCRWSCPRRSTTPSRWPTS
jgi:hypothetical protein